MAAWHCESKRSRFELEEFAHLPRSSRRRSAAPDPLGICIRMGDAAALFAVLHAWSSQFAGIESLGRWPARQR